LHDASKFVVDARIEVRANFPNPDHELLVYRYLGELRSPPLPLSVELVTIGTTIERK
jgi:hypothetical protein